MDKGSSENRQQAKFRRKKGETYMKKMGMTHDEWSAHNDPLFKVKGMERHKKKKELKI